ncbi:hypothetical protein SUGI_0449750 [Cryptomeria japonica]|nr:hypothetical protein SUGI_0449750 [Cryptomeria japonica]
MGFRGEHAALSMGYRADLVRGASAVLPIEFMDKVKGREFFVSWAPQIEVLSHPSVAGLENWDFNERLCDKRRGGRNGEETDEREGRGRDEEEV